MVVSKPTSEEKDKSTKLQYYSDTESGNVEHEQPISDEATDNSDEGAIGKIYKLGIVPFKGKLTDSPNVSRAYHNNEEGLSPHRAPLRQYSVSGTTDRGEARKSKNTEVNRNSSGSFSKTRKEPQVLIGSSDEDSTSGISSSSSFSKKKIPDGGSDTSDDITIKKKKDK
eukprot:TRINITY_DN4698_c0_g1_i2.p1 TRINITY_DN4698_c0_g1~~TRINITY_DN4698_c0_g1_i2.p1  ORF type:complete len:169 (+),score=32.96 TRINITY_DN4698_c0_g1_i2:66-572(+)